MSDLRDLYQELILDHSRKPRNFRSLGEDGQKAEGFNPLCGDRVTVYVSLSEDRLAEVTFQGSGCAICTASASLMTDAVTDMTRAEAHDLFEKFHRLLTSEEPPGDALELGKLGVFSGVREFPVRVKCATLAWHTLRAALDQTDEPVSTE